MNPISYIEQYLQLIPSFPFVIQVALYFIFFNTVAVIIFMAAAILIRRNKRLTTDVEIKFSPIYHAFLIKILHSEKRYTSEEVNGLYVEEFGTKKLNKKMYPSLISTLEKIVKEDPQILTKDNYKPVINGLEIEKFLLKKLDFSNTRNKLNTFQTLAVLDLTVPDSSILPFTHSSNPSIRKASRNSYVAISNNDPFKFFDQADNSLNTWDSIALMQQLEIHHKNNLPSFSQWIKYSKNKSQLLFVIKAVGNFNQKPSASALIDLLETEDHDVRREAIISLGLMKIKEAEGKMTAIYGDQPNDCQDAIIAAVVKINSDQSLPFLKQTYKGASSYESKKLIAEAIYKYNEEGKAYIQQLLETEIGFDKLILEHVKNPLIQSKINTDGKSKKNSEYLYNPLDINITT